MHLSHAHLSAPIAVLAVALAAPGSVRVMDDSVAAQPRGDESVVFRQRVSDYVQGFYARARHVLGHERVVLQPLDYGLQPQGRARRLEYEIRLEWQPRDDGIAPEAVVHRQLLKVDGRAPRPRDEPGCMDPRSLSPEPLAMLLPSNQAKYAFVWGPARRIDGRAARALDYRATATASPPAITWKDDCVTVDAPGMTAGRIWVDVESAAVLQLEERLAGRIDVPIPRSQQRVASVRSMSIERADTTIRYKTVTFADPAEALLLPVSIDSVTVIRDAGTPRLRMTQQFSNYRRFVTGTRIVN